jgi:hypothetical protein
MAQTTPAATPEYSSANLKAKSTDSEVPMDNLILDGDEKPAPLDITKVGAAALFDPNDRNKLIESERLKVLSELDSPDSPYQPVSIEARNDVAVKEASDRIDFVLAQQEGRIRGEAIAKEDKPLEDAYNPIEMIGAGAVGAGIMKMGGSRLALAATGAFAKEAVKSVPGVALSNTIYEGISALPVMEDFSKSHPILGAAGNIAVSIAFEHNLRRTVGQAIPWGKDLFKDFKRGRVLEILGKPAVNPNFPSQAIKISGGPSSAIVDDVPIEAFVPSMALQPSQAAVAADIESGALSSIESIAIARTTLNELSAKPDLTDAERITVAHLDEAINTPVIQPAEIDAIPMSMGPNGPVDHQEIVEHITRVEGEAAKLEIPAQIEQLNHELLKLSELEAGKLSPEAEAYINGKTAELDKLSKRIEGTTITPERRKLVEAQRAKIEADIEKRKFEAQLPAERRRVVEARKAEIQAKLSAMQAQGGVVDLDGRLAAQQPSPQEVARQSSLEGPSAKTYPTSFGEDAAIARKEQANIAPGQAQLKLEDMQVTAERLKKLLNQHSGAVTVTPGKSTLVDYKAVFTSAHGDSLLDAPTVEGFKRRLDYFANFGYGMTDAEIMEYARDFTGRNVNAALAHIEHKVTVLDSTWKKALSKKIRIENPEKKLITKGKYKGQVWAPFDSWSLPDKDLFRLATYFHWDPNAYKPDFRFNGQSDLAIGPKTLFDTSVNKDYRAIENYSSPYEDGIQFDPGTRSTGEVSPRDVASGYTNESGVPTTAGVKPIDKVSANDRPTSHDAESQAEANRLALEEAQLDDMRRSAYSYLRERLGEKMYADPRYKYSEDPKDAFFSARVLKVLDTLRDDVTKMAGTDQYTNALRLWHAAIAKYADSPELAAGLDLLNAQLKREQFTERQIKEAAMKEYEMYRAEMEDPNGEPTAKTSAGRGGEFNALSPDEIRDMGEGDAHIRKPKNKWTPEPQATDMVFDPGAKLDPDLVDFWRGSRTGITFGLSADELLVASKNREMMSTMGLTPLADGYVPRVLMPLGPARSKELADTVSKMLKGYALPDTFVIRTQSGKLRLNPIAINNSRHIPLALAEHKRQADLGFITPEQRAELAGLPPEEAYKILGNATPDVQDVLTARKTLAELVGVGNSPKDRLEYIQKGMPQLETMSDMNAHTMVRTINDIDDQMYDLAKSIAVPETARLVDQIAFMKLGLIRQMIAEGVVPRLTQAQKSMMYAKFDSLDMSLPIDSNTLSMDEVHEAFIEKVAQIVEKNYKDFGPGNLNNLRAASASLLPAKEAGKFLDGIWRETISAEELYARTNPEADVIAYKETMANNEKQKVAKYMINRCGKRIK